MNQILDIPNMYWTYVKDRKRYEKNKESKIINSVHHIFLNSKKQLHMDEFNIDHNNPIFETIYLYSLDQ
jgi:hypothetical protein